MLELSQVSDVRSGGLPKVLVPQQLFHVATNTVDDESFIALITTRTPGYSTS